jgi:hypothetical protein
MSGFAGGSRPWSKDWRVRRSDFQGCAGSSKLAFRTEGGSGSHILGEEAVGDSRSAESAICLHFKPSSYKFVGASQAVVGNFISGSCQERVWRDGGISGGKLK